MQNLQRCLGCLGLLATAMLTGAMEVPDDEGGYELHWVDKGLDILRKRDSAACPQPSGWSLCPASVGGGCCPDNFSCGTDSCYATTAGPTSCGGMIGYYGCPLTAGAGCCPVGLICGVNDCIPPPGMASLITCQASSFNCPVSLGGGCCPNGRVCGTGVCWANTPTTLPVSETKTTTDSSGHTTITVVTSTVVITDGPGTTGSAAAVPIPQFIPSTVAKVSPIQTGQSNGHGGLSNGALGGIAAGVVVILLVIIAVATFIVLRLRKVEKASKPTESAEDRRGSGAQAQTRYHKSGSGRPSISEIGSATEADPLRYFPIMQPSPRIQSASIGDASPSRASRLSRSTVYSSSIWGTPLNPSPSNAPDTRHSSTEPYLHDEGRQTQRVSISTMGSIGHSRKPSDTSELEGPHGISELDTLANTEAGIRQRSNSQQRSTKTHTRNSSDFAGHTRCRSDSGTLGTVNEVYELHGHYGPAHDVAGQTAAELDRGSSPLSSSPLDPEGNA